MQQMIQQQQLGTAGYYGGGGAAATRALGGGARAARLNAKQQLAALGLDAAGNPLKTKKEKQKKKKRASKLEFKRVDQLWDSTIHNYKLTDTAEDEESSEYDQYLFNVRRTFDWEGKYKVRRCLLEIELFLTLSGHRHRHQE